MSEKGHKKLTEGLCEFITAITSEGYHVSEECDAGGNVKNLVCASKQDEDGALHGCSFWITQRNQIWYLAAWDADIIYVVPVTADIKIISMELLRSASNALWTIPEKIVKKYGLKGIRPEECDWDD